MKLIPKYQSGFGIVPVTYTPMQQTLVGSSGGVSTSSDTSKDKEDELFSKDIIKEFAGNALPSDMRYFLDKSNLFRDSIFSTGYSPHNTMQDIKSMLLYMNKMKYEKDNLDKARANITSIEGESEAALSINGGVYVNRDNNIELISVDDLESTDKVITNAQLLNIRANSDGAAFDSNITATLQNATSMKQIRAVIASALSNLGETESSNTYYINPNRENPKELIDMLAKMNISLSDMRNLDPNSLIEIKLEQSGNNGNEGQLVSALRNIQQQLTPNMRTLLEVKAKQLGVPVSNVLIEFVSSTAANKSSISMDIVNAKDGSKGSKKTSKESSIGDIKFNEAVQLLTGLGDNSVVTLNEGNLGQIQSLGTNGILTTKSKESLGMTTADNILTSSISNNLDTGNITIGGVKISNPNLKYAIIESANVVGLDLPIDLEAYGKGVITPNVHLGKEIQEVELYIRNNNITDINQINSLYEQNGLPEKYSGIDPRTGKPMLNTSYYRRFISINVIADNKAFPDGVDMDDNDRVEEVDDPNTLDVFDSIIKDSGLKDFEHSSSWFGGDEVWRGILYVPVRNNIVNAYLGSGDDITVDQAMKLDAEQQKSDALQSNKLRYNKVDRTQYGL